MKHIKLFNESSFDEVLDTIKDIVIEIEDLGFTININSEYDNYTISIFKGNPALLRGSINNIRFPKFNISEIRDVLERIVDYLPTKLSDIYVMDSNYTWRTVGDIKTYDNVNIRGVEMNIDK